MTYSRWLLAAILLEIAPIARAAVAYELTALTPGIVSGAGGINTAGQVTVYSGTGAYIYSSGTLTPIVPPTGMSLGITGINAVGQVTGWTLADGAPGIGHAVIWSNGEFTDLGTLGSYSSQGNAINQAGQVAGSSYVFVNGWSHAFRYSAGVMHDLGTLGGHASGGMAIDAAGDVAGWAERPDFTIHASLYDGTQMRDLGTLGGDRSYALGMNDKGQIVGSSTTDSQGNVIHAFLYSDGKMTDIGSLGGPVSRAYAINNEGVSVGYSTLVPKDFNDHYAFVDSGGVMTNLNSVLAAGTANGWRITDAVGINDEGQIAADAFFGNTGYAVLLTPVPELPASWSMLGGLVCLSLARSLKGSAPLPQNMSGARKSMSAVAS